jgi:hypothetical protein
MAKVELKSLHHHREERKSMPEKRTSKSSSSARFFRLALVAALVLLPLISNEVLAPPRGSSGSGARNREGRLFHPESTTTGSRNKAYEAYISLKRNFDIKAPEGDKSGAHEETLSEEEFLRKSPLERQKLIQRYYEKLIPNSYQHWSLYQQKLQEVEKAKAFFQQQLEASVKKFEARALQVLPNRITYGHSLKLLEVMPVTNPREATVYVEYDREIGVVHYLSDIQGSGPLAFQFNEGASQEYRSYTDPVDVLTFMSRNLMEVGKVEHAVKQTVRFVLDESVFDEQGVPRIDLTNVKHNNIILTKRMTSHSVWVADTIQPLPIKVELLITSKPPPSVIAPLPGQCCLRGRPPGAVEEMSRRLTELPFNSEEIKFASLFTGSGTELAIQAAPHVQDVRVKGDARKLSSEDDLRLLFEQSRGKTLVLLGHVKGGDYVVHQRGSNEGSLNPMHPQGGDEALLSVPIWRVREWAKQNKVTLIDIGCKTAEAIQEENIGFGVIEEYKSGKAIHALETALTQSKSFEEFFSHFASEESGLKFVIEPSFIDNLASAQSKEGGLISIFWRILSSGKEIWFKIAEITVPFS